MTIETVSFYISNLCCVHCYSFLTVIWHILNITNIYRLFPSMSDCIHLNGFWFTHQEHRTCGGRWMWAVSLIYLIDFWASAVWRIKIEDFLKCVKSEILCISIDTVQYLVPEQSYCKPSLQYILNTLTLSCTAGSLWQGKRELLSSWGGRHKGIVQANAFPPKWPSALITGKVEAHGHCSCVMTANSVLALWHFSA